MTPNPRPHPSPIEKSESATAIPDNFLLLTLERGTSCNPDVIRNRSDFRQIFISVFYLERMTWKVLARELTVKLDGQTEPANRSAYGGFCLWEKRVQLYPV